MNRQKKKKKKAYRRLLEQVPELNPLVPERPETGPSKSEQILQRN